MEKEETQGLEAFRAGEEEAFKRIFERYYHPLCAYAGRFLPVGEDVDDVVQDAFLALWNRREDFDVLPRLASFLFVSAHNACVNKLRHAQVRETSLQEYALYLEEEASDLVLAHEFDQLLQQGLQTLPTECRRVVQYALDGYKNQEIADRLQLSVQTVKNQKVKGFRILRTFYAGELSGESGAKMACLVFLSTLLSN